jgi:hypothetical protein
MHYRRVLKYGTTELPPYRTQADPEWLRSIQVPDGTVAVPVVFGTDEQFTYAIVDLADHEDVKTFRWRLQNEYASRSVFNGGRTLTIYMHRWLMNTPAGMDTDHINRNKLDNRRVNLRIVDRSTNNFNTPVSRANTSGYKGVNFFKATGRWRAYIKVHGKSIHLGYFPTKEDAIDARVAAEYRYLGSRVSDDVDAYR